MYYQGMLELLVLYVMASGGSAIASNGTFIIWFGDVQIVCATPTDEAMWNRLLGDLIHAGLPWPPVTGG